jgi:solute:Na+ symporter, SSS family
MSMIDWAIIAVYAAVVLAIGWVTSQRQNSTDEYFRGGRQLPWWAIGLSIIATSFSAASLLGGPGEGFTNGFLYLQLQLGDLIGYLLVIALFLPFFIRLNLTSAYEYLERRFDAKTRSLGSLCFLLFVIARLGGLFYAAALAFSVVSGLPLWIAILMVGIVSILYTYAGGIAAVIWTDVVQFGMIFVGLAAGIWTAVARVPGGMGALWQAADAGGKITFVNLDWDPGSIYSLPTALFAYGTLAFAVAGTNQQSVQRYVSCADEASGRKAIFLGWFAGLIGLGSTVFFGVLLFGFYSINTGALPADIKPDEILTHFIVHEVPPGAAGLLVTAIFAAAMSSIDSALHALATCSVVDFYDRYSRSEQSEAKSLTVAKALIVFWGILGILSAFYVASIEESLLAFLVQYTAMFLGPLLGLFLLGILVPRANANGAFYGTILAVAVLALGGARGWLSFPGIWQSAISAPVAVLFGYGISLLGGLPAKRSLEGLTFWK